MTDAPRQVQVYGNDHSPWVQAVLLGLHDRGIPYTQVTVPPLSVFLHSGILMPSASIDGGEWLLDSERILVELGGAPVDAEMRRELMIFFMSAARERTDSAFGFWHRFSLARDGHPNPIRRRWNHFWRAFSIFYFFSLITLVRRVRGTTSPESQIEQLSRLQKRLETTGVFFGGTSPDTVDYQLFGLVQMCASIPAATLERLKGAPELAPLREWTGAMQTRFTDYDHLYTARHFEPKQREIDETSTLDRACFWSGSALMWIAFPITLPAAFFVAWWIRRKGLVRVDQVEQREARA